MREIWLEQLEQVAREEILPFATMEKITEAAERYKFDARSLMELIKILWANDLVGYYEIKEVLNKKKAKTTSKKTERNQCKIVKGIYFAFAALTEAEYFTLIRERQNLLKDPARFKQMNELKQKIFYLYNLLNENNNSSFSPEILEKLFSDQNLTNQLISINPDNFFLLWYITLKNPEDIKKKINQFLNILTTRHQKLTQEINIMESLPQKIETHLEAARQTCTPIFNKLILVLENMEKVLKEWEKDKKVLKELNKNKKSIKKAFKALSSSLHDLEMLSLKLHSLIEIYIINEKKNELRKTETKIQQLKKAGDNLPVFIEKKKKENQILKYTP